MGEGQLGIFGDGKEVAEVAGVRLPSGPFRSGRSP